MTDRGQPRPAAQWLASGWILLLAVTVASGFWGASYDDAYITYRYADRWADGHGLTFNDGESVLGTTAPGLALLLGAADRHAGIDPPDGGTLLAVASLALMALLLLSGPGAGSIRVATAVLFAAIAFTCRWNIEMFGAEAMPAAALGALGISLVLRGEHCSGGSLVGGGLALGLAAWLRLDLLAASALVGLLLWREGGWSMRRFPWPFALAAGTPPLLLVAILQRTFGSPVPATLAGKQSEMADASPYGLDQWHWLERAFPQGTLWILLALAAAGIAWTLRDRSRVFLALAGAVLVLEVFYRASGVPFAPWYHLALVNGLLALAAIGAVGLGGRLGRGLTHFSPGTATGWTALLIAFLLALPVWFPGVSWTATAWNGTPDPRTRLYGEVGDYLARHSARDARVAAVEIGALAYRADRSVLDLVGLVNPAIVSAREEDRLHAYFAAEAPDYIMDAPLFRRRFLDEMLDAPAIAGTYRPVARFFDPDYPADPVVLLTKAP
ncbi:MAG: hypothetical protein AAF481_01110 [Acidobacteriota bacterium]